MKQFLDEKSYRPGLGPFRRSRDVAEPGDIDRPTRVPRWSIRHGAEERRAIGHLFHPNNVVLVGASDRPGHWSQRVYDNLKRFGFAGKVFPVNPNRSDIWGTPCFPKLDALPETPDHLAIFTPAETTHQNSRRRRRRRRAQRHGLCRGLRRRRRSRRPQARRAAARRHRAHRHHGDRPELHGRRLRHRQFLHRARRDRCSSRCRARSRSPCRAARWRRSSTARSTISG